jgi:hypothetical protein
MNRTAVCESAAAATPSMARSTARSETPTTREAMEFCRENTNRTAALVPDSPAVSWHQREPRRRRSSAIRRYRCRLHQSSMTWHREQQTDRRRSIVAPVLFCFVCMLQSVSDICHKSRFDSSYTLEQCKQIGRCGVDANKRQSFERRQNRRR